MVHHLVSSHVAAKNACFPIDVGFVVKHFFQLLVLVDEVQKVRFVSVGCLHFDRVSEFGVTFEGCLQVCVSRP